MLDFGIWESLEGLVGKTGLLVVGGNTGIFGT